LWWLRKISFKTSHKEGVTKEEMMEAMESPL
jgi:hypothetical protein